ncbi:hypothetical protein RHGRI_023055 [Rhododendron griersonianum]|uniref:Reverse transcriptase zinc-binding domain-containing protein n=2 Tax=Rhododendron griersonianum TaxID=479676 RepID=A0AAV6J1T8_9ERIC|nr:hypothetical protein RHGRI_023055 [Rhododendron griersonianum]
MHVEDKCVLCNNARETHHHLFFQCPFSSMVWQQVLVRTLAPGIPNTLTNIVDWLVQYGTSKVFQNLVLHSTLAVAVYGIWIERKARVFQGLSKQVDVMSLNVVNSIRDFLCSRRCVKNSTLNRALGDKWRLPDSIFSM